MKYAAYGSNLHPLRLEQRVGPVRLLGTGAIDDFALRFHKRGNLDGSAKCNIVEHTGSQVFVAVYDVADAAMARLDEAEGVGNGYERVEIGSEEFGRCAFYFAQASHIDDTLKPFTWYRDLVVAGCRWHGFPADYVETIMGIEAVADPDPERHALHESLMRELQSQP